MRIRRRIRKPLGLRARLMAAVAAAGILAAPGLQAIEPETPALCFPPAMAAYKLSTAWNTLGAGELLKGKTMATAGLVSKVSKSPKGPRLELCDGKVVCLPENPDDSEFGGILRFTDAGVKLKLNKSDSYYDYLVKVVVSGEIAGSSKPGAIELVKCSTLAWYGVEVTKSFRKSLRGLVPLDSRLNRGYGEFSSSGSDTLVFKIVCGSISSPKSPQSLGVVDLFTTSKGLQPVSGRIFRSSGYVEGFSLNIGGVSQVDMDSDPLGLAEEADAISQIMKRKGYVNALELAMRAEPVPGRNVQSRKLYKCGIIDSWSSCTQEVKLYKAPQLVTAEIPLSPGFAIMKEVKAETEGKEPKPELAGKDEGKEAGGAASQRAEMYKMWSKSPPTDKQVDELLLCYAWAKLAANIFDWKGRVGEALLARGSGFRSMSRAELHMAATGNRPPQEGVLSPSAGAAPSDEEMAVLLGLRASARASQQRGSEPPERIVQLIAMDCAAALAIDSAAILGEGGRFLAQRKIQPDAQVQLGVSKEALDALQANRVANPQFAEFLASINSRISPCMAADDIAGLEALRSEMDSLREKSADKQAFDAEAAIVRKKLNMLIIGLKIRSERGMPQQFPNLPSQGANPPRQKAPSAPEPCECQGSGKVSRPCAACNSTGELSCPSCKGRGALPNGERCKDCDGFGVVKCRTCLGLGLNMVKCPSCQAKEQSAASQGAR